MYTDLIPNYRKDELYNLISRRFRIIHQQSPKENYVGRAVSYIHTIPKILLKN